MSEKLPLLPYHFFFSETGFNTKKKKKKRNLIFGGNSTNGKRHKCKSKFLLITKKIFIEGQKNPNNRNPLGASVEIQ